MKNIKVNEIFRVVKGKRNWKWKVIEHPYYPDQYALVKGYDGMSPKPNPRDAKHIQCRVTLNTAYSVAYDLT